MVNSSLNVSKQFPGAVAWCERINPNPEVWRSGLREAEDREYQ